METLHFVRKVKPDNVDYMLKLGNYTFIFKCLAPADENNLYAHVCRKFDGMHVGKTAEGHIMIIGTVDAIEVVIQTIHTDVTVPAWENYLKTINDGHIIIMRLLGDEEHIQAWIRENLQLI